MLDGRLFDEPHVMIHINITCILLELFNMHI